MAGWCLELPMQRVIRLHWTEDMTNSCSALRYLSVIQWTKCKINHITFENYVFIQLKIEAHEGIRLILEEGFLLCCFFWGYFHIFFRLKTFYILKACCMLCRSWIALRQTWECCSFLSEIVECYVLLREDMFMCPLCTCVSVYVCVRCCLSG